jgi:cell shape-determining protein MreC
LADSRTGDCDIAREKLGPLRATNQTHVAQRTSSLFDHFVGLKTEQVKRLKDLELENSQLRKAVSDLTLDKLNLTEAAKGNF